MRSSTPLLRHNIENIALHTIDIIARDYQILQYKRPFHCCINFLGHFANFRWPNFQTYFASIGKIVFDRADQFLQIREIAQLPSRLSFETVL